MAVKKADPAEKESSPKKKKSGKRELATKSVSYPNRDVVLQMCWMTKDIYQLMKVTVAKGKQPTIVALQAHVIDQFLKSREADTAEKGSKSWHMHYYVPRRDFRKALAVPSELVLRARTIAARDSVHTSDLLYNAFLDWYLKNARTLRSS